MTYDDFIKELLVFLSLNDNMDGEVFWDSDLNFFVMCSDAFFWGTADLEPLTPETFDEYKKAFKDAEEVSDTGFIHADLLYCARRRGMRPQGAYYKHIKKDLWPLFDACGPVRDTNILNPIEHK